MFIRIHHVAVAVRSLGLAYRFYRDALGLPVHKAAVVQDQGVKAALLPVGGSEIELIEPIDPGGGVAKFLEKRGEGLHHVCFETDDIAKELEGARVRGIALIDQAPRRGLAGLIGFMHPKANHGVLVECVQAVEAPGHVEAGRPLALGIHRLAVAVADMDAAAARFAANFGMAEVADARPLLGPLGKCLRLGEDILELLQPISSTDRMARFLVERGEGMCALALRVKDVQVAVRRLEAVGFGRATVGERGPHPPGWIPPTETHGVPLLLTAST